MHTTAQEWKYVVSERQCENNLPGCGVKLSINGNMGVRSRSLYKRRTLSFITSGLFGCHAELLRKNHVVAAPLRDEKEKTAECVGGALREDESFYRRFHQFH